MIYIFVNLKRFEVPRARRGICPVDDPWRWISSIIEEAAKMEAAAIPEMELVFLLAEGLILSARNAWEEMDSKLLFSIGCQAVHWQDISKGGNFGAFTSLLPAIAARNIGCSRAMIGHSEERRAKMELLMTYDSSIRPTSPTKAPEKRQ
jgi:triosephosphate isomerase